MSYRIRVKTIEGNKLTYPGVPEYKLDGGFITFTDQKNKKTKIFAVSNCEIELEGESR